MATGTLMWARWWEQTSKASSRLHGHLDSPGRLRDRRALHVDLEHAGFEFLGVTFDNVYDPGTSVVYPGTLHPHPDFHLPGPGSGAPWWAKDIGVVVLDEEVAGIQPALLPSAGLLDQLAKDGDLKGQSFTVVGYGFTELTHEPGSGAPVFGDARDEDVLGLEL